MMLDNQVILLLGVSRLIYILYIYNFMYRVKMTYFSSIFQTEISH